jgi:two-component sensor histidine kinase/PAS domain-containing protein
MSTTPETELARDALDLGRLREAILDKLIAVVTVLATVPVAGGIWLSILNDVPAIAVFDAVCWVLLVVVWRARLPTMVRAVFMTLLPGLVGHVLLAAVGPLSLGAVWLGAVPALAGVLFDRRAFWIALGGVVGSMVVLWVFVHDSPPWIIAGEPTPLAWWITAASSIVCISSFVGLPATYLVSGLERSLAEQARNREALRALATREAALHRQFEQLFARTPQALLMVAGDGRIAQRNEAARALFEATGAPRPDTLDALFVDPTIAEATRQSTTILQDGSDDLVGVARIGDARRADGAPLVVETRVVPLEIAGERFALVGAPDVARRVAAEQALSRALREKETLLQEVHHRVKNNLQVVSSLLGMQASLAMTDESRAALEDSTHRIRTMALIHQQLYGGSDFSAIELGEYARSLAGELRGALDPRSELHLDVDVVHVALAQALPCGLILNELVTNAFKHGRDADGLCRVTITLRASEGGFVLRVADAGRGFTEDWSTLRRRSLGAQIVESLVRQLRARLEVASSTGGASFMVHCPLDPDVVAR